MVYSLNEKKLGGLIMKIRFLCSLVLICILSIAGCANNQLSSTTAVSETKSVTKTISLSLSKVDNEYKKITDIYTQAFQDNINEEIQKLKKNKYTIDKPLAIANPYCTITNGLYLYFTTPEKVQIQYTVTSEKYHSFKQVIYENKDNNLSTVHEISLIGIIPDAKNTIKLTVLDKNGKSQNSIQFDYDAPSKLGKYDDVQVKIKKGESKQKLSNGLYVILGNDLKNNNHDGIRFLSMYDNHGVLRCEIPITEYRSNNILYDDNGMYFSVDHSNIVRMDKTGYINHIYSTKPYEQHHDCIFGTNNDLLVLGKDPGAKTTEDLVLDIDLKNGKVKKLIDLKDYFPNYYKITSLPKGQSQIDWMHLNSLTITDDGKLLVSSRETSTVIAFDNFYSDNRKVDYMLGSDNFWAGTGYENLLFTAEGEFSLHSGQHNITYIKDTSLKDGAFYLNLYNNNSTISTTRPDYDWLQDDNYKDTGVTSKPTAYSYYYKYLVDENTRKYKLIKKIAVPYSAYVSSIQDLDNGNVLIDSGSAMSAYEYDKNNKLIQSITVSGTKWTYRIFKKDFKGFWFK